MYRLTNGRPKVYGTLVSSASSNAASTRSNHAQPLTLYRLPIVTELVRRTALSSAGDQIRHTHLPLQVRTTLAAACRRRGNVERTDATALD